MAGLSDYAEQALLNALLRGTNFTSPTVASLSLALFTADPNDGASGNEATGSWYVRKPTGAFTAPAVAGNGMQCTNLAAVTFNAVTGAAVTITHVGIYDALTGGNLLFSSAMPSAKTLQVGDVLSFAASTLIASLD